MKTITYSLSNGKKVKFEGVLGHTQYLFDGRFFMSHRPALQDFKGVVKSATRISLGQITLGKDYSNSLIIERKGRKPLTARLERVEGITLQPVIARPASGSDLDLSEVIKRPSRPSIKGEAVKQGSVIRLKAGTPCYVKKYDRGMSYFEKCDGDQSLTLLITGDTSGRPISQDGALGEPVIISDVLQGIISGYGLARETGGFEVIMLGSDSISHSAGTCL